MPRQPMSLLLPRVARCSRMAPPRAAAQDGGDGIGSTNLGTGADDIMQEQQSALLQAMQKIKEDKILEAEGGNEGEDAQALAPPGGATADAASSAREALLKKAKDYKSASSAPAGGADGGPAAGSADAARAALLKKAADYKAAAAPPPLADTPERVSPLNPSVGGSVERGNFETKGDAGDLMAKVNARLARVATPGVPPPPPTKGGEAVPFGKEGLSIGSSDLGKGADELTAATESSLAAAMQELKEAKEFAIRDREKNGPRQKAPEVYAQPKKPAGAVAAEKNAAIKAAIEYKKQKAMGTASPTIDLPTTPPPAAETPAPKSTAQLARDAAAEEAAGVEAAVGAVEEAAADGEKKKGGYQPKVNTWGVFERPANISEAYGGGRTIRPGEALEAEEKTQERVARVRQKLAQYNREAGNSMTDEEKADAEAKMKAAQRKMDNGDLNLAAPMFKEIADGLNFKTTAAGEAMLMHALCLDSMGKNDEARDIYANLCGHPNMSVSKRARGFFEGFEAAEFLKADQFDFSIGKGEYESYLSRMADTWDSAYTVSAKDIKDDKEVMREGLAYVAVLVAVPLILIITLVAKH